MRSVEKLMRDRQFLAKMIWLGFIFSLVLIGIGLFVIVRELLR